MRKKTVSVGLELLFTLLMAGVLSSRAATFTWVNPNSGDWSNPANWSSSGGPGVPGAQDTAIITNEDVTVTLDGATTVGGIILGNGSAGVVTLSLAGRTLALNGPLTVNPSGSFTVDGGELVGNTNAVLSGEIGWTGGLLGGTLTLSGDATLTAEGAGYLDMPN